MIKFRLIWVSVGKNMSGLLDCTWWWTASRLKFTTKLRSRWQETICWFRWWHSKSTSQPEILLKGYLPPEHFAFRSAIIISTLKQEKCSQKYVILRRKKERPWIWGIRRGSKEWNLPLTLGWKHSKEFYHSSTTYYLWGINIDKICRNIIIINATEIKQNHLSHIEHY